MTLDEIIVACRQLADAPDTPADMTAAQVAASVAAVIVLRDNELHSKSHVESLAETLATLIDSGAPASDEIGQAAVARAQQLVWG